MAIFSNLFQGKTIQGELLRMNMTNYIKSSEEK